MELVKQVKLINFDLQSSSLVKESGSELVQRKLSFGHLLVPG